MSIKTVLCTTSVLAVSLALVQCAPKPPAPPPAETAKAADYSYDIALTFTPEAAARVAKLKDKVTISALYYGTPTPATAAMADKSDGEIHLNTDLVDTDSSDHTVHMTAQGVDPVRLKYIVGNKPMVLINVYSTHKGAKDEKISCSGFEDYVADAQGQPLALKCS